ncbi:MAG: fibronectin type III domain-containing protein [Bacteroidota bacterium]
MNKQYLKAVFKSYNQKQLMLLPPSLDELIEPGHPVRIVPKSKTSGSMILAWDAPGGDVTDYKVYKYGALYDTTSKVIITDNMGVLYYSATKYEKSFNLSVQNLKNGNYIVVVENGKERYSASLVVLH